MQKLYDFGNDSSHFLPALISYSILIISSIIVIEAIMNRTNCWTPSRGNKNRTDFGQFVQSMLLSSNTYPVIIFAEDIMDRWRGLLCMCWDGDRRWWSAGVVAVRSVCGDMGFGSRERTQKYVDPCRVWELMWTSAIKWSSQAEKLQRTFSMTMYIILCL